MNEGCVGKRKFYSLLSVVFLAQRECRNSSVQNAIYFRNLTTCGVGKTPLSLRSLPVNSSSHNGFRSFVPREERRTHKHAFPTTNCLHDVELYVGKKKVKLSLYRPTGFQGVETPRIYRQSVHEGVKVSPTHRPTLPPPPLVLISVTA